MTSDIAAVVARVRTHVAVAFEHSPWGPSILSDIIAVCDFAARHTEAPAGYGNTAHTILSADAPGIPPNSDRADLVETVARALCALDAVHGVSADQEWRAYSNDAQAVLAAIADRIVPEGCVVVPADLVETARADVVRIAADYEEFDGDRRGIASCLFQAQVAFARAAMTAGLLPNTQAMREAVIEAGLDADA